MSSNLDLDHFNGENKLRKCFNSLKNVKCDSRRHSKRKKNVKLVLTEDFDWRKCVVDFRHPEMFSDFIEETNMNLNTNAWNESMAGGISDPKLWKCYMVKNIPPGFIVIPGAFGEISSKYWFKKLIKEIPFNDAGILRSNVTLPPSEDSITPRAKGNHLPGSVGTDEDFAVMMRWISFGYAYDWDAKKYSETDKENVPQDIAGLFKDLTSILGINFKVETGVINYYNCKSRLSAHVDQSEGNLNVPLISLSFGSDAILIVGGLNQTDETVIPLLLKSGDIVIMSREARLIWHSVPKVFCENHEKQCENGRKIFRINLNARQVN